MQDLQDKKSKMDNSPRIKQSKGDYYLFTERLRKAPRFRDSEVISMSDDVPSECVRNANHRAVPCFKPPKLIVTRE